MEAIPEEWIDKLFICMEEFYGERWAKWLESNYALEMYKTIWKNGLCGLNYEQIKKQLQRCKRYAKDPKTLPPHVMEFFREAKVEYEQEIEVKHEIKKANEEIARHHLALIKKKLMYL